MYSSSLNNRLHQVCGATPFRDKGQWPWNRVTIVTGIGIKSTLRGKTFLPENIRITICPNITWYLNKKLTKCPNFTWYLPNKYFSQILGRQTPSPFTMPMEATIALSIGSAMAERRAHSGIQCENLKIPWFRTDFVHCFWCQTRTQLPNTSKVTILPDSPEFWGPVQKKIGGHSGRWIVPNSEPCPEFVPI